MFKIICEDSNKLDLIFMPYLFVADFEQTIHNNMLCMKFLIFLNSVEVGVSFTDDFMLTISEKKLSSRIKWLFSS